VVVVQRRKFKKCLYTACGRKTLCSNDPREAYNRMPKELEVQLHMHMHWPTLFKGRDEVFWEKK
jgi:hypothetical protein